MPIYIAVYRRGRRLIIRSAEYPAYHAAGWRLERGDDWNDYPRR